MPLKTSAWWKTFIYLAKYEERFINLPTDYLAREIGISRGQVEYALKVLTSMKLLNYDRRRGFDTKRVKDLFEKLKEISQEMGKEAVKELVVRSWKEWKGEYERQDFLPIGLVPFSYVLDRYNRFPSFEKVVERNIENLRGIRKKRGVRMKRG